MESILADFKKIESFIFDVDGVFTDSSLLITEKGELLRTMNSRDGFAVKHAINQGYKVIIITGGTSEGVRVRLKGLGVDHIFIGVQDKEAVLRQLVDKEIVDLSKAIYMGDDIPDLGVMKKVFLPVCPADAATEIQGVSRYVSPINGGRGCVREVIETTLRVQDKWL